jgi:hypothetical protein
MAFGVEIEVAGRRRWIERHVPLTQRGVLGNIPIEAVVTVQADGHELDEIIHTFSNVPWSTARVNKWRGEWARFIVENLPY